MSKFLNRNGNFNNEKKNIFMRNEFVCHIYESGLKMTEI